MNLTPRQKEVLRLLYHVRNREILWASRESDLTGWVRPMDIGGTDGSFHSRALNQLVEKKLVAKSLRQRMTDGGSYRYKITSAGVSIAEGEDSDSVS